MDAILRAATVYGFLLVLLRVTGKRTLSQITVFDFVLLLVVSEATQQALLANDYSITMAVIVITTLVALDRAFDVLSKAVPAVDRLVNGMPLVLIEDGHLHRDRMQRMRVDVSDILEQARQSQGVARLEDIRDAVLERTGASRSCRVRAERLAVTRQARRAAASGPIRPKGSPGGWKKPPAHSSTS